MDPLPVSFFNFKRTVKQSHLEFYGQNPPDTFVYNRFGQPAFLYQFDQMFISIRTGSFHIHSGCYRLVACFLRSIGGMMKIVHHADSLIVGKYISVESPLVAQYILQQPLVGMDRHTIYLMVARHYTIDIRLLDCCLEGIQMIFAQFSFSHQCRSDIDTGFWLGIGDKMFAHSRQFSGSDPLS